MCILTTNAKVNEKHFSKLYSMFIFSVIIINRFPIMDVIND